MITRISILGTAVLFAFVLGSSASSIAVAEPAGPAVPQSGIVAAKSAYPMTETIARLKQDIADKGIKFFIEVDQSKLAAEAGIIVRPSTLLIFGNPPLGTLFIAANPLAGLDWPVRLLVFQDEKGDVWTAYTDFGYIARRHEIKGMDMAAFDKASGVIASITSSVSAKTSSASAK
jgi:uncharacterized protein (DUF302 family)